MKWEIVFLILLTLPFWLNAHEPHPLPIPIDHGMSHSTVHLSRTIIDINNGSRHESRETIDIDTVTTDLADLTAAIYFNDSHYPLREYIEHALRKKIAAAKLIQEPGTKTSLQALEDLMIQKSDLKESIDLAHKDAHIGTFVHRMVMESIEDAFIERDNEIVRKEKSKKEIADALLESRKLTRIAAWGHIANSLLSAGITAGIILASIYGPKS
jgi:hypothetical protein